MAPLWWLMHNAVTENVEHFIFKIFFMCLEGTTINLSQNNQLASPYIQLVCVSALFKHRWTLKQEMHVETFSGNSNCKSN
jgi:hypothetical protein